MKYKTLKSIFSHNSIVAAGLIFTAIAGTVSQANAAAAPRFKIVVLAELLEDGKGPADDQHRPYVEAAKTWLNQLAKDSNFTVTYLDKPDVFTDAYLSDVDLIWQMNYAPYGWPSVPKLAFEKYMNSGKGGWLGVHHATLYGLSGTEPWPFFFKLIGQINFKGYVRYFASGDVHLTETSHPIFNGVPSVFNVATEEWYTYDHSPSKKVHVLGNVDESSYKFVNAGSDGGVKMGADHPVIWTNDSVKTRNLYVFMGHHPNLWQNQAYVTLIKNAIFWITNKPAATAISKPAAHAVQAVKPALRIDKASVMFTSPAGAPAHDAAGRTHFQTADKEEPLIQNK